MGYVAGKSQLLNVRIVDTKAYDSLAVRAHDRIVYLRTDEASWLVWWEWANKRTDLQYDRRRYSSHHRAIAKFYEFVGRFIVTHLENPA